jgi:hypothetical protein
MESNWLLFIWNKINEKTNMESEDTFYIRHKVEDNVYTQTSYTGQIRWRQKEKDSQELILQQQVTISTFGNYVITKQEVSWVDVPVEWIKD